MRTREPRFRRCRCGPEPGGADCAGRASAGPRLPNENIMYPSPVLPRATAAGLARPPLPRATPPFRKLERAPRPASGSWARWGAGPRATCRRGPRLPPPGGADRGSAPPPPPPLPRGGQPPAGRRRPTVGARRPPPPAPVPAPGARPRGRPRAGGGGAQSSARSLPLRSGDAPNGPRGPDLPPPPPPPRSAPPPRFSLAAAGPLGVCLDPKQKPKVNPDPRAGSGTSRAELRSLRGTVGDF